MTSYPFSSGVYYQNSTIRLTGKDSYLTIKAYNDDPVTISGGILLNNPINNWVIDGQIRTATFPLETVERCGPVSSTTVFRLEQKNFRFAYLNFSRV